MLVTPSQLALILHSAKPNLFGAVDCKKEIKPNSRKTNLSEPVLQGRKLHKEFGFSGMATMSDYENSVNNSRERQGMERTFVKQPLKWGEHWNDSPIVITHKGQFYLQVRVTKNTVRKGRFTVGEGENEVEIAYSEIEPFLKSDDKLDKAKKNRKATAEHQGLNEVEAVHCRCIAFANIERLAYQGEVYELIPEPVGGVSVEREEEREEEQQA